MTRAAIRFRGSGVSGWSIRHRGSTCIALCICACIGGLSCRQESPEEKRANRVSAARPQSVAPTLAELRAKSPTQLTHNAPATSDDQPPTPPEGVREVIYRSGDLRLKAWIVVPKDEPAPHPAVVYFHNGFALGSGDFDDIRPFLEAGFAVMLPMLRGENGNPGVLELFWGELDDAAAAVTWLANQPEINREQIFAFGHSIGGGISSLLTLVGDEVPIRHSGSCGGLYPPEIFQQWTENVPFDPSSTVERSLRTLLANTQIMRREHHAYLGVADPLADPIHRVGASKLHYNFMLGDHLTALAPSIDDYARRIHSEVFAESRSLPVSLQPLAWKHPDTVPSTSVIPDARRPKLWNVKIDPFPDTLAHYRGDVRCPLTITTKRDSPHDERRGDFAFPYSFHPVAQLTPHPRDSQTVPTLIDLTTMKVTDQRRGAEFQTLYRHNYGFGDGPERWLFHWPGARDAIRRPPSEVAAVVSGVYGVSPGQRYVVAFSDTIELIVWDANTRKVVGRTSLPPLPEEDNGHLRVAEFGFAPDGTEFAAVLATRAGTWLINWHWASGNVTAFHTGYAMPDSSRRQHAGQLQFLEDGQGWLVELGQKIIDRETGTRRPVFGTRNVRVNSTPRLIAGHRFLAIWQDPADMYNHEVRTFTLTDDD